MTDHRATGATGSGATGSAAPRRRRVRPYLVIATVLWVIPALVWVVLWARADDFNAGGQCEGIGFGCSLTPQDSWEFIGGIFLIPVLGGAGLLAMVGTAVMYHLRDRRD